MIEISCLQMVLAISALWLILRGICWQRPRHFSGSGSCSCPSLTGTLYSDETCTCGHILPAGSYESDYEK